MARGTRESGKRRENTSSNGAFMLVLSPAAQFEAEKDEVGLRML
jgi:hypothetical protein